MNKTLSAPPSSAIVNEWLTPLQFSLSLPQLPALARTLDRVGALEKVPTFPASAALPAHTPVPLSF